MYVGAFLFVILVFLSMSVLAATLGLVGLFALDPTDTLQARRVWGNSFWVGLIGIVLTVFIVASAARALWVYHLLPAKRERSFNDLWFAFAAPLTWLAKRFGS